MKRYIEDNKIKLLFLLSYITVVFFITQYEPGMTYHPDYSGARLRTNFIPFVDINRALYQVKNYGLAGGAEASTREVIKYVVSTAHGFFANILMFIPFGILLPALSKKFDGLIKIGVAGFFGSLLIEVGQIGVMILFTVSRRAFDVDDLIANTMGAVIGYIIFAAARALYRPINNRTVHGSAGKVF